MNLVKCKTFTAQITIGLYKGYSKGLIPMNSFKQELFIVQESIKNEFNIVLSAKIKTCEIFCLGQDEPSIELEFIQYPKFITEETILKKAIIALTKIIMLKLEQNRVVIVFND